MADQTGLPTFTDVEGAYARIKDVVHRTPVLTSRLVDARVGARLFFKAENFQRVGAFKFRGAANAIARLDDSARSRGVVAYSSGNHAQAIALAASLAGVRSVIVMPEDAPVMKLEATRAYGAQVVTYDRYTQDRQAIGASWAERDGLTIIPPFDHPDVIAGQGTASLELFEEVGDLDFLFVPLGGGGLLSGSALTAAALCPSCKVIGVEPLAGNDVQQSLKAGKIVSIDVPKTIADGAQTTAVGALTFPLIQRLVHTVVTAPDQALVDAMRLMAERMKIVVEPTGCLGLAAAMSGSVDVSGARVGVILSGGNIDMARFASLLASPV